MHSLTYSPPWGAWSMSTSDRALFREFFDQVIALHHVTESKRHSPETRFM